MCALGVLARAARRYEVEVHAHVFLSNHYHLLVSVADVQQAAFDTIATLRAAGLRTVMLTGDQRLTEEAIGRALGVIDEGDAAILVLAIDLNQVRSRLAAYRSPVRPDVNHQQAVATFG